jgi:DNA polymerase III sliding clamp (beta) subunit (PCNA family)
MVNGVHIKRVDETHGRVEATDGHQLVRIDFPALPNSNFPSIENLPTECYESVSTFETIVPTSAWENAAKNLPKKVNLPILSNVLLPENVNGSMQLITTDLDQCKRVDAKVLEGNFPNTDVVIPTELPVVEDRHIEALKTRGADIDDVPKYVAINFNPELLASVLETLSKVQGKKFNKSVKLYVPVDNSSALVIKATGEAEEKLTAVVMPMRD